MPSHVRSRNTREGGLRYDITYRRGGRGYPLEHAGTFKTKREADIRRKLVDDWLAHAKDPKHELAALIAPPARSLRFEELADSWLAGRVDLDDSTIVNYRMHLRQINEWFGPGNARDVTTADIVEWIGDMVARGLKPGTVRQYMGIVRQILDVYDDNPARHRSVRLPKKVRAIREPPDADEYLELLDQVDAGVRGAVAMMEQTGMRISEAHAVASRDIDRDGCRVLVATSKTDRPRWIPIQPWYAQVVEPTTSTVHSSRYHMRKVAPHIHPHLLRHRRGTLWHQDGIVAVELAARLGHANPGESLQTYVHVRPISEAPSSRVLEVLGQ